MTLEGFERKRFPSKGTETKHRGTRFVGRDDTKQYGTTVFFETGTGKT